MDDGSELEIGEPISNSSRLCCIHGRTNTIVKSTDPLLAPDMAYLIQLVTENHYPQKFLQSK